MQWPRAEVHNRLPSSINEFQGGGEHMRFPQHGKILNGKMFPPIHLFKVKGLEKKDNHLREAW